MKKILLLICLMMGAVSGYAQIVENREGRVVWGARAAFDVNLPGRVRSNVFDDRMFRNGTGGTLGGVCNISLGNKFYLEPALSIFYDTYSYNDLIIMGNDGYEEKDPSVYKVGFRLPVVVGYSIGIADRISIAPFTGPELSYSFAGSIRVHDKERLELDNVSLFGPIGSQRRIECGWKIGLAFFSGMWSFNIDGTIGITNLMTNGTRFRESRGSVSLTRYF